MANSENLQRDIRAKPGDFTFKPNLTAKSEVWTHFSLKNTIESSLWYNKLSLVGLSKLIFWSQYYNVIFGPLRFILELDNYSSTV